MIFAAKTDMGLRRTNNEDTLYSGNIHGWYLFIVADGVGGRNAGEVASHIAVDCVVEYLTQFKSMEEPTCDMKDVLKKAMKLANDKVFNIANKNEEYSGMGTTMSALLTKDEIMVLGHVGDSRIYFFRDGKLEQLTSDHSYVADLLRTGVITKEEAKVHPKKNYIYRNLGNEKEVDVDIDCKEFKINDKLMLCSDGLSDQIEDNEMLDIFLHENNPEVSINNMFQLVLERGGFDNISAIIIHNMEGEA